MEIIEPASSVTPCVSPSVQSNEASSSNKLSSCDTTSSRTAAPSPDNASPAPKLTKDSIDPEKREIQPVPSDYIIEQLSEYDDVDLVKPWQRSLLKIHPLIIVWLFSSYAAYYGYRVYCIYEHGRILGSVSNPAWILTFVEGVSLFPTMLAMTFFLLSIGNRNRPKLRLRGEVVPSVDVLITTCGEELAVIMNTVRAACTMDYPTDRYRVLVCDDRASMSLKNSVDALSCKYSHLYYQARDKPIGIPHHFKTGNLQSGIDYVSDLRGGPGEYIATLDADMIPSEDWLRALLPHLLQDDKLALICPPQTFWNLPPNDPIGQSLCEFVHYTELKKDYMCAAWCTGSGVVFKRYVIELLGGWPTGSMAEDQLLSYMMNGIGYKTAYVHEFLQVGMVPDNLIGHLKQRIRWAVGGLEAANLLKWGFPCKKTKLMTFRQRWCVFALNFNTLVMIPVFIAFFVIPGLFFMGGDLLVYTTPNELAWQIRLCASLTWAMRANDLMFAIPTGYIQTQRGANVWPFMVPFVATSVFRCWVLPTWLGGTRLAFQATGSITDELKERDADARAGVWRRIRLLGKHCNLWFFVLFVAYSLSAVGTDWYHAWKIGSDSGEYKKMLRHLLVNSCLPPMWWLFTTIGMLGPLVYVISPPSVPPMEDVLVFDKNGVGRPKEMEIKQTWDCLTLTRDICWMFVLTYVTVLFAGTFTSF